MGKVIGAFTEAAPKALFADERGVTRQTLALTAIEQIARVHPAFSDFPRQAVTIRTLELGQRGRGFHEFRYT